MRLVGNLSRREIFYANSPLEISPGRAVWEEYRGHDYVVFVDESFFEFFGFSRPDGNFCHSAIGIPANTYPNVARRLQRTISTYERKARDFLGATPEELKFSILRRLPIRFQSRLIREIAMVLHEEGGFVSGFYTPTDGFIMEDVRESLLDVAEAVPQDHRELYAAARDRLIASMQGPGQSQLIAKLLYLPVAAVKFMLGSFGCNFRIQYDPRQREEDHAVREAIGQAMDILSNVTGPYQQPNNYLGMDVQHRSQDELGLQIADVVAGSVRDFFRNVPDALIVGASDRLITATSDEPLQVLELIDGMLFKKGALHRMPAQLRKTLTRRNLQNLVSYFYPVLAAGILTCNTSNGIERDIELSTGLIFDLLD